MTTNNTPPRPEMPAEAPQPGTAPAEQAAAAGNQPNTAPEPAPAVPPSPFTPAPEPPLAPPETAGPEPQPEADAAAEAGAPAAKTPPSLDELARTVEALLFAAEEPLAVREMARAAGADSASVRKVLPKIKAALGEQRKAWDLTEVGGGYRLVTRPEFYPAIQRLKTQTRERKLTQAGLETLALIAYRQPIGRADIESTRGVGCGPVLRLLLDKKLIQISGRGTGLGHPLLYGTTGHFLEHFGLKSIEELPKPGELKPQ